MWEIQELDPITLEFNSIQPQLLFETYHQARKAALDLSLSPDNEDLTWRIQPTDI